MSEQDYDLSSNAQSLSEFSSHRIPEARLPQEPQKRFARRTKAVVLLIIIGMSVLGIAGYMLFFDRPDEPIIVEGHRVRAIQLDVLNAAGENRLAQRVADFLRARGFDVVEMGNALTRDQSQTIVIDRTGNLDAARRVAEALGIPEERVVQKIDPTLFLDVTVMIGKDYQSLKPWR